MKLKLFPIQAYNEYSSNSCHQTYYLNYAVSHRERATIFFTNWLDLMIAYFDRVILTTGMDLYIIS